MIEANKFIKGSAITITAMTTSTGGGVVKPGEVLIIEKDIAQKDARYLVARGRAVVGKINPTEKQAAK